MHPIARQIVRRAFHSVGLEVHRVRDVPTPSPGIPRHSLAGVLTQAKHAGLQPATVIDVGAAFGTFPLYQTFPESRHLLIEPLQEWEAELRQICSDYRAEYVLAVAASSNGTRELNVYPYILGSSLLQAAEGGAPRTVPAMRLDALCASKRLAGPYIIKVDAEGAELDVLAGATGILKQTELIVLEIALFEFFDGCPLLAEIVAEMHRLGFEVYDVVDMHYRPLDGAVAKMDLAFAPARGTLRRFRHWGQPSSEDQQRDAWLSERFQEGPARRAA